MRAILRSTGALDVLGLPSCSQMATGFLLRTRLAGQQSVACQGMPQGFLSVG